MDVQEDLEPVTPLCPSEGASRRAVKIILLVVLVLGLTGSAVLAVRTVDSVRGDQPAQATAGSFHTAEPVPVVPARMQVALTPPSIEVTVAGGPKTGNIAGAAPTGLLLRVGDRLKLAFYERVDVEEDKWGRASTALSGIVQRPELSGEYAVQEDGTIFLPLLGAIRVAKRSMSQVQADLAETFERVLGRKGLINILSVERQPIYVLGPVKNPGSFKYSPGMTILHAIALAGGLDRSVVEPWQKIEAVREIQKRHGAIETLVKLLARQEVLKAERDGTEPKIPHRLLELFGDTEATKLVNEQRELRKSVAAARKQREQAILAAVESAKQDLSVYGRAEALDELVRLRQERVTSMRALVDRNVLNRTVLDQVQSELTDAEQRRRDALNHYGMAKQRLAAVEAEALRVQADLRNDLELEIETIKRQVADNEREFTTSEKILGALQVTRGQFANEANQLTYQVIRQTEAGPLAIESIGMTQLEPGDLLNIVAESGRREQAGAPAPTSLSGQNLSAGGTAKGQENASAIEDHPIGTK